MPALAFVEPALKRACVAYIKSIVLINTHDAPLVKTMAPAIRESEMSAEFSPQNLSDMEAIKKLKATYMRCADTKKWDQWAECLAEDCRLETEAGIQHGRETAKKNISESLKDGKTVHRVTAPEITFTGPDDAQVIWAMQDVVEIMHKGQRVFFHGYGYYEEEYVRTSAGWRIKSTKLVRQRVDRA
jgi:3-phenylpropionate/cinnamic acid dioxygenase small subunit